MQGDQVRVFPLILSCVFPRARTHPFSYNTPHSKNWDRFGFSPQSEEKVEGSFYRIDKPIVQSVVNQLYDNVIARLPFTSLNNLKLHLQSNVEPSNSATHNCSMQLKINYRYPQN